MVGILMSGDLVLSRLLLAYFRNSGWMLMEHGVRAAAGLFVGVLVARHLGSIAFGMLNFALAVVALTAPLVRLGIEAIVIRRIAAGTTDPTVLVGTALRLRLGSGVAGSLVVALASFVLVGDPVERLCLIIIGAGFIFQTADVLDFYFQGTMRAALTSACRTIAVLLAATLKLWLVWRHAGLEAIALATLAEHAFVAIFYVAAHAMRKDGVFPGRLERGVVRPLLIEARPLMLSGLAVAAYTRMDQILLRQMLGTDQVGLYAASVNLVEALYFLPLLFAGAAFPVIVSLRERQPADFARIRRGLYRGLLVGSILLAALTSFFASSVIALLYGAHYAAAADVLAVHVWTLVFTAYSAVFTRILMSEGRQSMVFRLTIFGLAANLAVLWPFTALGGVVGAAWAALFGHLIISAGFLIGHPPARDDLVDAIRICRKRAVS